MIRAIFLLWAGFIALAAAAQGSPFAPYTPGAAFVERAKKMGFQCMEQEPAALTTCLDARNAARDFPVSVLGVPVSMASLVGYQDSLGEILLFFRGSDFDAVQAELQRRIPAPFACSRSEREHRCLQVTEHWAVVLVKQGDAGMFVFRTHAYRKRADAEKARQATQDPQQLAAILPTASGWYRGEMTRYERKEFGVSVAYRSRHSDRVDVYIYPGVGNSAADASPAALQQEFESARAGIHLFGRTGRYQDVAEGAAGPVSLSEDANAIAALRARFSFTVQGEQQASDLYLFVHRGMFIKIRATRQQGQTEEELAHFLRELDRFLSAR